MNNDWISYDKLNIPLSKKEFLHLLNARGIITLYDEKPVKINPGYTGIISFDDNGLVFNIDRINEFKEMIGLIYHNLFDVQL